MLAERYPLEREAMAACRRVGLNVSRIDWGGSPSDRWFSAVSYAQRAGQLDLLHALANEPAPPSLEEQLAAAVKRAEVAEARLAIERYRRGAFGVSYEDLSDAEARLRALGAEVEP
jgi:hypothetical protein